jgi:acyl-CoA dehydrogenase
MYLPRDSADVLGAIEAALAMAPHVERIEAKIRAAQKAGTLSASPLAQQASASNAAEKAGIISAEERAQLAQFASLRDDIIKVDHFPADFGVEEAAAPRTQRAAA